MEVLMVVLKDVLKVEEKVSLMVDERVGKMD
jgi:hypothetical protein